METLAEENRITLNKTQQRLLEKPAITLSFEEAELICNSVVKRVHDEKYQFEHPSSAPMTGWWRSRTERQFERRLTALLDFKESITPQNEWDEAYMQQMYGIIYSLNLDNEGL